MRFYRALVFLAGGVQFGHILADIAVALVNQEPVVVGNRLGYSPLRVGLGAGGLYPLGKCLHGRLVGFHFGRVALDRRPVSVVLGLFAANPGRVGAHLGLEYLYFLRLGLQLGADPLKLGIVDFDLGFLAVDFRLVQCNGVAIHVDFQLLGLYLDLELLDDGEGRFQPHGIYPGLGLVARHFQVVQLYLLVEYLGCPAANLGRVLQGLAVGGEYQLHVALHGAGKVLAEHGRCLHPELQVLQLDPRALVGDIRGYVGRVPGALEAHPGQAGHDGARGNGEAAAGIVLG